MAVQERQGKGKGAPKRFRGLSRQVQQDLASMGSRWDPNRRKVSREVLAAGRSVSDGELPLTSLGIVRCKFFGGYSRDPVCAAEGVCDGTDCLFKKMPES